MMLTHVVDAYLAKQRSLGARFESAEVLLRRFCRAMGNRDIGEVTPEAVVEFLQGKGSLSATWTLRYRVLSGLYSSPSVAGTRHPPHCRQRFQSCHRNKRPMFIPRKNCAACWTRPQS